MALIDNIVSYWKFDESSGNAADSVGSNTLTNVGTAAYEAALINNGVAFGTANTTKYFDKATDFGVDGGSISMNFWFKLQTEIGTGSYSLYYLDMIPSNTRYRVEYNYNGGTRQLVWYRATPGNGGSDKNVAYTVALGTSSWHMITYTYDGTTLLGYVDGVQQASVTASGSGSIGLSDIFTVGAYTGGGGNLNGRVDESGVWSRALTGTEITELYNGGAGFQYPFTPATSGKNFLMFM